MDIVEKVSGPGGASQKNWTHFNNSVEELPLDMRFNHGHMVSIAVYSVLMVISATGNLTVLSQLVKRRRAKRASRLDLLLMHLAVADLMVSCFDLGPISLCLMLLDNNKIVLLFVYMSKTKYFCSFVCTCQFFFYLSSYVTYYSCYSGIVK